MSYLWNIFFYLYSHQRTGVSKKSNTCEGRVAGFDFSEMDTQP